MQQTVFDFWPLLSWDVSLVKTLLMVGVLSLSVLLRKLFSRLIVQGLYKLFSTHQEKGQDVSRAFLDTFSPPLGLIFIIAGLFAIGHLLGLPVKIEKLFLHLASTLTTFTVFWTTFRAIGNLGFLVQRSYKNITDELYYFIATVLKIFVAALGFLSILESWDINVGAFIGGLGLLTAAVGFAAKDTIANLFASVSVFMDQTFRKGDWIKTPEVEGTVEHIGIRTSAIRQFDKALVVVPNEKLANAAVINFTRMTNRRIFWTVALRYDTTAQQLTTILDRFTSYLKENPEIETNPKKVTTILRVDGFGKSGIHLFLYFFTKTTNWIEYMRVKEQCALELKKIVEEEGSEFAFPSRSLYLEQNESPDLPPVKVPETPNP